MDNQVDLDPCSDQSLIDNSLDQKTLDQILVNFNENLKRKALIRANKLSDLQDSITSQVEKRLSKHADEFSNRDLIDYFKIFQDTLSKASIDSQSIPNIQITQNQLNIGINSSEFDQDERKRILTAVRQILSNENQNNNEELEVIEDE